MSVDYSSVLIYGYRIPAEEVERIKANIGDAILLCSAFFPLDKWALNNSIN